MPTPAVFHLFVPSLASEPLSLGIVVEGKVWAQRAVTSSLGLAPTGCVTLGKLLPLSEHLRSEMGIMMPVSWMGMRPGGYTSLGVWNVIGA